MPNILDPEVFGVIIGVFILIGACAIVIGWVADTFD